jgi:hypothetical protein
MLSSDEGQRHEVGYFRHGSLLAGIAMKSPARVGVGDSLHQFADLGLQIFIRDDQCADRGSRVAATRSDGLIHGRLQSLRVLRVRL